MEDLSLLTISELARLCLHDWKPAVGYGAAPYLDALRTMHSMGPQNFGADDGKSIVLYFLSNANTWRGPTARAIKAELKKRIR